MKRAALLVALSGCNAIFGLDETTTYDARHIYDDAMVDAPAVCPSPDVIPEFDRELHQAIYADSNCQQYQTSAVGIALATCFDAQYKQQIYEARVGPITDAIPARGDINTANGYTYSFALAPEGSELFAARYDPTLIKVGVWRYERDATGMWQQKELLPFSSASGVTLSPVTRGPHRHILVRDQSAVEIHEWALDDTGTWNDVAKYDPTSDFGSSAVYGFGLSADGLRLPLYLYDATAATYVMAYSYRASVADRFSMPVPMPSAPRTQTLFLTEDCDRAYFAGFGAVFYVKRI